MCIRDRHVSVECVEVSKEDAPEGKVIAPRIVIITDDGQSYACVSVGVYHAYNKYPPDPPAKPGVFHMWA